MKKVTADVIDHEDVIVIEDASKKENININLEL